MAQKLAWAGRRAEGLRRILMNEPRGHADLGGAVLTEAVEPGADAGVLFMDGSGFRPLSGHGIMAVTTIALERGLVLPGDPRRVVFDTALGAVRARVERHGAAVARVVVSGVPSFVFRPGIDLLLPGRRLRADVAFGGGFYAIVDAESAGVPVDGAHLGDLRRAGMAIAAAVDAALDLQHPLADAPSRLAGAIFTAPPREDGAALRSAVVRPDGTVERSPSGTGTAAIMAVLDAMGLLPDAMPFVHESVTGQLFEGRVGGRTRVGETGAIVPEVAGRAAVTGDHTFVVADDDPLPEGFRLS